MATSLTAGKIYFIEAAGDLGAQTDWIAAGGDPDTIDLDQFTEGLRYFEINIPEGFTRNSFSGAVITPSGSGTSFDLRDESRFYRALMLGVQTSLANANLVDKFVMSKRHTAGDGTFVRYFMVVYFGTNNHLEFTDHLDTRRSYCKGIIMSASIQWFHRDNLNFILRINWESVWRVN